MNRILFLFMAWCFVAPAFAQNVDLQSSNAESVITLSESYLKKGNYVSAIECLSQYETELMADTIADSLQLPVLGDIRMRVAKCYFNRRKDYEAGKMKVYKGMAEKPSFCYAMDGEDMNEWLRKSAKSGNAEAKNWLQVLGLPLEVQTSEPHFPGTEMDLLQFLMRNIRYPQEARERRQKGMVYVSFMVNEDGSISDIRIEQGVCQSIDDEAMRIVSLMPKWVPGRENGVPKAMRFYLPVNFQLQ